MNGDSLLAKESIKMSDLIILSVELFKEPSLALLGFEGKIFGAKVQCLTT